MNAVIFDLDGTLLDTTEGVLESAEFAARKMGYKSISHEEWLSFIGPPIQDSFITYYDCSFEEAQRAANIFRDYYKNTALFKAVPYEGIYDLCDKLAEMKIKMSVATYKREDYAVRLLKHFGFEKYCNPIHGADDKNILTKRDIIELCIKELAVDRQRCVLIGDTEYDAIGAEKTGIPFIGVTYGFGYKNCEDVISHHTIGVAEKPLDILEIIKDVCG